MFTILLTVKADGNVISFSQILNKFWPDDYARGVAMGSSKSLEYTI